MHPFQDEDRDDNAWVAIAVPLVMWGVALLAAFWYLS